MDWIDLLGAQLQPEGVFAQLGYVPSDRQSVFHAATEPDVLYGGAAGGGKTKALLMEAVKVCVQNPGVRALAFRRTWPELRDSLLAELAQVDFCRSLGANWRATDKELVFPNKAVIAFRFAENIADATKQQGAEYQAEFFDELTLNAPDVVTFLRSRLRSGRAHIPVIGVRSASNPGGVGHGAVKAAYIDATQYGELVTPRGVRFIPSKVDDNPYIDAGYRDRLDNLPEAMRKAFRDGSWDAFAGQYFTEWSHDRHIVPASTVLPPSWMRIAGVDWGYAAPWAVLWLAVDEDGRVWVYDELYATQVGESDQARRIKAAEEAHGVPVTRYGDDAMWTGRGDAKPISEVYSDHGCDLIPAKKGERLTGWQRVRSYLADGPACPHHRGLGWETCPMLHVIDGSAPNLVRTMPTLPYDTTPSKVEDIDTKAEDHAADALRYALLQLGPAVIDGWLEPEPDDTVHPLVGDRFDPMAIDPDETDDHETWQEVTGWDF